MSNIFFYILSPPAPMKYKQIKNGVEGFSKTFRPIFYLLKEREKKMFDNFMCNFSDQHYCKILVFIWTFKIYHLLIMTI